MVSFYVVSLILLSMLFIVSTFYYVFSLLVVSLVLLVLLCSTGFISSLVGILLYVVYVGAMMVLIGYICAVCPNVLFKSSFSIYSLTFMLVLSLISLFLGFYSTSSPRSFSVLFSMYCPNRVYLFVSLVLILFFVLLMVTTQHLLPKGPFRSVSQR